MDWNQSYPKRKLHLLLALPPELWRCIFDHATYVPDTLIPDVYAHASLTGSVYSRSCNIALRDALVTKRALVRVCKQWWHLAVPYLYRSVYIGRARCLPSLSSMLVRSAAGKGTVVGTRPLGEYTERLDVAIRDYSKNPDAELDSLTTLITCMPHLVIVSFAMVPNYFTGTDLSNNVLHALQYSAASLRVLDWSTTYPGQSASRFVDFLAKCTQLRVLNCPLLVWSRELQHGGIPLTVTTLRVRALIPVQLATNYHLLSDFDPDTRRHPGPSALQELILDLNPDLYHWEDLLNVYSAQLVSVQLYISGFCSNDVDGHLQLLARVCPDLRRLTITSGRFSSFIRPNFVFPSITCLRLRATQMQLPKPDFEMLFAFLEELKSSVPSLQVVQLVDEYNVQCLLKTHTKFAVRALQPFMEATPFRIEDKGGVLLTDRLKALGARGRPNADTSQVCPSSRTMG